MRLGVGPWAWRGGARAPPHLGFPGPHPVHHATLHIHPLALEIEGATCPVLVLAHEAPCRLLRAFFLRSTRKDVGIRAREAVDASFGAGPGQTRPMVFEYKPNAANASFDEAVHIL